MESSAGGGRSVTSSWSPRASSRRMTSPMLAVGLPASMWLSQGRETPTLGRDVCLGQAQGEAATPDGRSQISCRNDFRVHAG